MTLRSTTVDLHHSFRSVTMGSALRAAMRRAPQKVAVKHGERVRTYAEIVQRMDRVTHAAIGDIGLRKGDTAAILAHNCLEFVEIVCGIPEAGAAIATVSPRLTAAEIVAICDDSCARVLFVDAANAPIARAAKFATVERIIEFGPEYETWLLKGDVPATRPEIHEWDLWAIVYTSGTTGKPKGVMISHRSRVLSFFGKSAEYGCFTGDDRFLSITPMYYGAGLSFTLNSLCFGGFCEIMDKFDPAATLRKLKYEGFTGIFVVPTHFHAIFALDPAILKECKQPPIRTIISNAAPLPQAMKQKIVPYFGATVLHEIYSSTETSHVSSLRPADQLRKVQCVGLPLAHTEVRILNEAGAECAPGEIGELFCKSPFLFNGYWKMPEETAAAFRDGWASVGDLARRDEEGYLYIVGRKNDMIISGGINIYPREIEEILASHPDVLEAAVIGVPDDKWGERLKAFLVAKDGHRIDAAKIIDFCTDKLGAYKIPKDLAVTDSLPRNANGKILKTELRKLAS